MIKIYKSFDISSVRVWLILDTSLKEFCNCFLAYHCNENISCNVCTFSSMYVALMGYHKVKCLKHMHRNWNLYYLVYMV